MYELPSHLMPHPSEVQEEMMSPAETLLRAGPWGFSMVSDSTGYVACPGCGQRVSDERVRLSVERNRLDAALNSLYSERDRNAAAWDRNVAAWDRNVAELNRTQEGK